MKPAPFDLVIAETWEEALDSVAQCGPEGQILAGGQSLIAMLNMRLARPNVLIDINRIPNADRLERLGDSVRIGAITRQWSLERWGECATVLPLLAEALPHIGHVQTRARGTVCGSLCHADPSSELPLCLVALEGMVELSKSGKQRRIVAAQDFFLGPLTTARQPDEIVTGAIFPTTRLGEGYAFSEIAERHGDFALACFAAVAGQDFIRLAVGGVADRPVVRVWSTTDPDDLEDALNDFAWDLEAVDDPHATARYRRDLVRHQGIVTVRMALARRST